MADCGHMRGPGFRSPADPFVQETTKISEIRDNFGKLRFKVFLVDMLDYYEEASRDEEYRISVESYCYGMQPVVVLTEYRRTFGEAKTYYARCVDNYKALVLAETKNFEDIRIYAERIGYRKIAPECCATCKYSQECPDRGPSDVIRRSPRLRCMNAELFKASGPRRHVQDIQPEVQPDCVCDHFVDRRTLREKWFPCGAQPPGEFKDGRPETAERKETSGK